MVRLGFLIYQFQHFICAFAPPKIDLWIASGAIIYAVGIIQVLHIVNGFLKITKFCLIMKMVQVFNLHRLLLKIQNKIHPKRKGDKNNSYAIFLGSSFLDCQQNFLKVGIFRDNVCSTHLNGLALLCMFLKFSLIWYIFLLKIFITINR